VCEEYVAHIGASLSHATLSRDEAANSGELDLTDPMQFGAWLELHSEDGYRIALEHLTDTYMRLLIPRFILAMGKSSINTVHNRQLNKTKSVLEDITAKLEATLPAAVIQSEPDFIRLAYLLLAEVNRKLGLIQESETSAFRATDEYLIPKLDYINTGMIDGTLAAQISEAIRSKRVFYEGAL
jgi:hypothetical protein